MTEGTEKPSFLSYHLARLHQEANETPEEFVDIKIATATIYAAGADTTWSSIFTFMLATTLHPGWQFRAHQELDAHLGGSRLPKIGDRDELYLVDCIPQETFCWLNAVPLGKLNPTTRPKLHPNSITSGIPHRALEDGVCTGMFIPKGSLVIANTRWTTDYESELMSPEPPLKRYIYERGSLSQAIFF